MGWNMGRDSTYQARTLKSMKKMIMAGGEGGIRTPGTLARTPHFECGAIDHSATSPGPTARRSRSRRKGRRPISMTRQRRQGASPARGDGPLRRTIAFALDRLHGDARQQRQGLAELPGELRIRGVAVERTLVDALVDRNAAKEAEGEEEGPIGDVLKPQSPAIGGDIFGFGRYPARRAVDAAESAIPARRQPPLHALVGEVGEWMAKRRQLPVEDREQTRRLQVEDHVVDAPVAMHQRDPTVVDRDLVGEPGDEALHVVNLRRLASPVLVGPA